MTKTAKILAPALLLMLGVGCGAMVQVGAYKLHAATWEDAKAAISSRASFELKCPIEQLQLTVIAAKTDGYQIEWRATQVGVDGCGHRAVYVARGMQWLLNSESGGR